jgi:hypothetical protein
VARLGLLPREEIGDEKHPSSEPLAIARSLMRVLSNGVRVVNEIPASSRRQSCDLLIRPNNPSPKRGRKETFSGRRSPRVSLFSLAVRREWFGFVLLKKSVNSRAASSRSVALRSLSVSPAQAARPAVILTEENECWLAPRLLGFCCLWVMG